MPRHIQRATFCQANGSKSQVRVFLGSRSTHSCLKTNPGIGRNVTVKIWDYLGESPPNIKTSLTSTRSHVRSSCNCNGAIHLIRIILLFIVLSNLVPIWFLLRSAFLNDRLYKSVISVIDMGCIIVFDVCVCMHDCLVGLLWHGSSFRADPHSGPITYSQWALNSEMEVTSVTWPLGAHG